MPKRARVAFVALMLRVVRENALSQYLISLACRIGNSHPRLLINDHAQVQLLVR